MSAREISKDGADKRSKIVAFEAVVREMPQIEIPIEHHFAPGIYLRQMTMPAGSVVVGKIHKTEHLCILSKGQVIVASEEGTKTLSAPAIIHSMPGTKRALHALTEVVWVNAHHNPTNERDTDKIEEIFVAETFDQYLEHTEKMKLEGGK